jgi:uncharacterized protein YndB with AHSA1/START domain
MSTTIEARVSHRFRATAGEVYDAWLDPAKARRWMAAALQTMGLAGDMRQIEIEARVGGKFLFSDQRGEVEARHWGTYLELERPRRIVFTWIVDESEESKPSTVFLTIQPDGDGCVVTIVHQLDAAWAEYVPRVEAGWGNMLAALEKI